LRVVLDALKGVAYEDDSQATITYSSKAYSTSNGCTVRVQEAQQ
jgi:Holliday junction resolvase RusA-like endonuclease